MLKPYNRTAALLLFILLVLAGCGGTRMAPPASPAPQRSGATLPDNSAAVLIQPNTGGTLGLRDGTQLTLPRGALTQPTLVTLRASVQPAVVPIPRSIVGRAYDVSFEGGNLTGVALLTLPLPDGVTADQYDVAAYRWSGRAWERQDGRLTSAGLQVGVREPAVYAILGQWRMSDASVSLALQPAEAGSASFPLAAHGQYRYSVPPTMQHDYVEARLTLKRDSTGGAGQVAGTPGIDKTVAETVLWFKPDPGRAQGAIEFAYTFQVEPTTLGVPLGSVSLFYAVLEVNDSPAPTRRLSTGAQYTLQVPIKAVGSEIVRPEMADNQQDLQWHVRLNGQTLFRRPAGALTLPLSEVLAQGGLGEYRITLDAELQGKYVPVSNEITVRLAVPGTPTPPPSLEPNGSAVPGANTPWPFGTMPPTPTRRKPPTSGTPSPLELATAQVTTTLTVTPSVASTPSVTPTRRTVAGSIFWSDRETVAPGECTTLRWNVQDIAEIYIEGSPTTGNNVRQVCPSQTTSYTLKAIDQKGASQEWRVTISVQSASSASVDFTVDRYQIKQGECANLSWHATNVTAVYLNEKGVAGEASQSVCPTSDSTYVLRIEAPDTDISKRLTVYVVATDHIVIPFWADQYTLQPKTCTTLHWAVQNVDEVHLQLPGQSATGVAGNGSQQVCPNGTQSYSLEVKSGDNTQTRSLSLQPADIDLASKELIAQGIISNITELADIDPDSTGDMAGYQIDVEGITSLVKGYDDCCSSKMKLLVRDVAMKAPYRDTVVDWPLHVGQLIEFRFQPCDYSQCKVFQLTPPFYLKMRSN